MFTNRYPGKCQSCKTPVAPNEGFAYKNGYKWLTVCKSTACFRRLGLTPPTDSKGESVRELKADGTVIMPFDRQALPLLRSMPGARWNPENKTWTVSVEIADLRRVVEVADQLRLTVPESLREAAEGGTAESREAKERAATQGLYDYQREGVEFLALHKKALLADDMGLGKTVQTLVALPPSPRVIVVCPATIKFVWVDEVAKWRPDLKVSVLKGRNSFKFPEPGEIVVINYDILPKWLMWEKGKELEITEENKALLAETILICDEAHRIKNYKAARSRKIASLSRLCQRTWLLTGSPLENKPPDLFGIVTAGNMNPFGRWSKFVDLFNGYHNGFGIDWGQPKPEVPERLKRVMIRRRKSEVLKNLPPKTYQSLTINDLSASLRKHLDKIEKSLHELPPFEDFSAIRALLAESRIPAMLDIVADYEETDTPLVVFSAHKKPIIELGKRDGWACITGDTKNEERQSLVRAFQNGELKGLAMTIKTGGVGITLTRASNALFVDLAWTPGDNIQAEDRICRIGQQADSIVIQHMRSDHPLDRHIQALIVRKMETMRKALDESLVFNPPRNYDKPGPSVVEESEAELRARLEALEAAEKEAERQEAVSWVHNILGREQAKATFPEPELTPGRIELIRNALEHLIARCDGARERDHMGFNKPDAAIAHWIYRTGLRDDDLDTLRVTERILSRYHRQLAGFAEIWTPTLE